MAPTAAKEKGAGKPRGNGKDKRAGEIVEALRKSQGLSRAQFANVVSAKCVAAGYDRQQVEFSVDLLELIEIHGHEPGPRIVVAIAVAFGMRPGQIWSSYNFSALGIELPAPRAPRVLA
jgi:transcriptional regulator with XRE-family HTH domain